MPSGSLFDKLSAKFDEEVLTALRFEKVPSKLSVIRHHARPTITSLIHTALLQGDAVVEVKLALHIASELLSVEETLLGREVYEIALRQSEVIPNRLQSIFQQVDAITGMVLCEHKELTASETSYDAPMVVSRYLNCLTQLRTALDLLFEMSTRQQEENAWKIINVCKLLYKIGQPLAWYSCGKYIVESFLFAAGAMESVINLCTVRHLKFRLKLYSSALYTMLAQGMLPEARNVLQHLTQEVTNLVERESLDPPIPPKIQAVLSLAQDDMQVLTQLTSFFENPEDISGVIEFSSTEFGTASKMNNMVYAEKVMCECARVHHMTAGTANEAWKKRANCLVKLFHAFASKVAADRAAEEQAHTDAVAAATAAAAAPTEEGEPPVEVETPEMPKPFCFSVATLLEMALLVLFDPLDGDIVPVETVLEQLWTQVAVFKQLSGEGVGMQTVGWQTQGPARSTAAGAVTQGHIPGEEPPAQLSMNEWELRELDLLQEMLQIIALGDSTAVVAPAASTTDTPAAPAEPVPPVWLQLCRGLILKVEELMFSDHEHRRQHFLQRVVVCLWSRVIFPRLQNVLSLDVFDGGGFGFAQAGAESTATASLAELSPLLLAIVRIMDLTHMEDAVLVSSLSLITGLVFRHIDDYRGALSLLKQALVTLDNFRAARVDASMHLPDDKRDVLALQRASFSCSADEDDWFHSLKRLGAHAFAGYGLFGTGSAMDRTDKALAEINVDMLALYFRTELEYNLEQAQNRLKKAGRSTAATNASLSRSSSAAKVGTMLTAGAQNPDAIKVEELPCSKALRVMCGKNVYARALLNIEMARLDRSGSEESVRGFLKGAKECIEEAEADEAVLKDSFMNLDVVRSPAEGGSAGSLHRPIVLARTHKCVYLCPVGSRLTHRKASYMRVFGKEQGSGTAVSLSNDDLEGCDITVKVADLSTPAAGMVCVKGLAQGERYVFGAAAFTDQHQVVGSISATTVAVGTANPLPTGMLWSVLAETAQDLGVMPAAKFAAGRACARFFDTPPEFEPVTLGKGINVSTDPHLCMLAVQQASPVLLRYFVRSFLIAEAPACDRQQGSGVIHWDMKRTEQERVVCTLRRIGLVVMIAAYTGSHELVVRCICLGYAYLCYLTEYDETNLAPYTQQPLTVFLSALQTVPKRHWRSLEHHLYCRLLSHLIKAALANHSTLSAAALLDSIYTEANSTNPADDAAKSLGEDELHSYLALMSTLRRCDGLVNSPDVQTQLSVLFKTADGSAAWKQTHSHVAYSVLGKAAAIAGGSLSDVEHALKAAPEKGSQLLNLLVNFVGELREQLSSGSTTKSAVVSLCGKLMNSFAVAEGMFAPKVKGLIRDWQLSFLKITPVPDPPPAGSEVPTAAPTAAPSEAGSRLNTTAQQSRRTEIMEEREQLKALGALTFAIAQTCYSDSSVRQHFPHQTIGPFAVVMASDGTLGSHGELGAASNVSSTATLPDTKSGEATNRTADLHTEQKDYVRYLCASVALLVQARCHAQAVTSAVSMWNFLVDEFQDPRTFALDYRDVKKYLHLAGEELVHLLETLVGEDGAEGGVDLGPTLANAMADDSSQVSTTAGGGQGVCPPRDVKEYLFVCRDLLVFLIKVLWILEDFVDVVEIGSRVLSVYMTPQGVEYCKPFDKCLPLITHAQEQLLKQAQARLDRRRGDLDAFVADYEDQQRKKRKKKVRIARLEKDDSELKFDADKAVLDEKIYRAEIMMKTCTGKLDLLLGKQKKFESLSSTSTQLLDKLRRGREEVYLECVAEVGIDGDFGACLKVKHIREKIDGVFYSFDHVCHLLREKKDKITLIEALKEQGDLYLLVGKRDDALSVWRDAVDGLFNVMDTHKQWRAVAEAASAHPDSVIIEGCLPIVVVLGKLSRFTAANDWDSKAGYCRMAAEMCKVPFTDSYGHPVSVNFGFAAYVCRQLGGVSPLVANGDKLSIVGLHEAFAEILNVLFQEGCHMEALPVVVLWEHLHSNYSRRADYWLRARLWRVRLLVALHLFAEAAAMLASIEPSLPAILQGIFSTPLKQPSVDGGSGDASRPQTERQAEFDTQRNGLDCYGCPPFMNHLPPHHPDNQACLTWVAEFEAGMVAKLLKYKYDAPVIKREADEYAAAMALFKSQTAIYQRDVIDAPKGKGAPPPPSMTEPVKPDAPVAHSGPMFSHLLVGELQYICAEFLSEVARLDSRLSNANCAALKTTFAHADDVLKTSLQTIALCVATTPPAAADDAEADATVTTAPSAHDEHAHSPSLTEQLEKIDENVPSMFQSANWTSLYGRCLLLAARQFIADRRLKDARALLLQFLRKLQPAVGTSFSADVKAVATQLWFACKDLLVDIAAAQARHEDVIRMCTQFCAETAHSFCGFWLRSFVLRRSIAYFRLGMLAEADEDCDALYALYRGASRLRDLGLVRGMVHKATVLRERIMVVGTSMSVVATTMRQCVYWVKRAVDMAENMCRRLGGFTGGADANMSFRAPESAVLKYDVFSPLIHSLNNLHSNDPVLSLRPLPATKKSSAVQNGSPEPVPNNWSTSNLPGQAQRLGPVDAEERYVESPFANIYLRHMRVLAVCQAALCRWLDEVRSSEAVKYFKSLPPAEAFMLDAGPEAGVEEEEDLAAEQAALPMGTRELLEMQSWVGEDALKVLRYVVYCPPAVRVALLLNTAKSRVAKLLLTPEETSAGVPQSSSSGTVTPTSPTAAADMVVSCDSALFLPALRSGLELGVAAPEPAVEGSPIAGGGVHAWRLLNDICIELVECYGNNRLQWSDETDDGESRLKMASLYLIAACKLRNQFSLIVKSPLKLCTSSNAAAGAGAGAMAEPLTSPQLSGIVAAYMTTATTASYLNRREVRDVDASVAADAAPPAVADVATGRDAACLLSAVLRECDPYWQDGFAEDLCLDTHHLLRTQYPAVYGASCCLSAAALPTASSVLSVFVGGVYSQWVSTNCIVPPGQGKNTKGTPKGSPSKNLLRSNANVYDEKKAMYNWFTGYFLLGVSSNAEPVAGKGDAQPESTGQPFLTKVVLRRKDVVDLEQQFRNLRTRLAAAVINTATPLTEAGDVFGSLLCRIITLVNEASATGCEAKYSLIEDPSNSSVSVDVVMNGPEPPPCKVPLSDSTLGLLSECFTNGVSVDGAIDTSVCTFLRLAFLGK